MDDFRHIWNEKISPTGDPLFQIDEGVSKNFTWRAVQYLGDSYADEVLIRFADDKRGGVVHFLEGPQVALVIDFDTKEVIGIHIEGISHAISKELNAKNS